MTDGTGTASMTCFSPHTDGLIKDVESLLKEVENKTPDVIPLQILALENTRHVFQFRFAKSVSKGPPTFILQKVMDEIPSILPGPTETPSSPPRILASDQSAGSSSPPPVTPSTVDELPTETRSKMRLPRSAKVRKELFKTPAEEHDSPERKKQKKE